jgi:hypothetical protein
MKISLEFQFTGQTITAQKKVNVLGLERIGELVTP